MSEELIGVMIGGSIGIVGSILASLLPSFFQTRRARRAAKAIIEGELQSYHDRACRFLEGHSTEAQAKASKPIMQSYMDLLPYLASDVLVNYRRCVVLAVEFGHDPTETKAQQIISATQHSLMLLRGTPQTP